MSIITNIIEWLSKYYGMIFAIGVLLLILFHKRIKLFFSKKKKTDEEEPVVFLEQTPDIQDSLVSLEENNLFNNVEKKNSLSLFKQQKAIAEKYIRHIQAEGRKLIQQENKTASEYQQKINQLNIQKKQLGIKYTTGVSKLRILETMILSQIRMEEELEKLKNQKQ